MISIASPDIGPEEITAVNAVLTSGMLVQGPRVSELEENFAAYCGTKYAAAVNSGTAALHCALHAAGVGPGDEVITTPFSFIATINPILFLGAKPVIVDIDPETFNLDVSKIEAVITPKTKAILPVHLFGQPCDYSELQAIADAHNLAVIEDACQAIGADYGDQKTGGLGTAGCFSLYATKNIMSGEGGMVTSNDEAFITAVKQFRQHGMSGPYQYEGIGYNYRMTDLQAAIGTEQLKKVDRYSDARRANAAVYDEAFKDMAGIITPTVKTGRSHVYHQYTIRITEDFAVDRQTIIDGLKAREIGSGLFYPKGLHTIPHIAAHGYKEGDFPEAEKAAREVLSLPVHPKITADDVRTVVAAIREVAHA